MAKLFFDFPVTDIETAESITRSLREGNGSDFHELGDNAYLLKQKFADAHVHVCDNAVKSVVFPWASREQKGMIKRWFSPLSSQGCMQYLTNG